MTLKKDLRHAWIIMLKEFKLIFRKKELFISLFLFPIVMIVFFSYGMGGDIVNAPILIVNNDLGTDSLSIIENLAAYTSNYDGAPMFSLTHTKDMSQSVAQSKIDDGLYKAVLIIPHEYSLNLGVNKTVNIILLTDTSDTTTSNIIVNFMRQFFSKSGLVSLIIPNIYGNLAYKDYLTPAIIAFVVFLGAVFTTGSAIAGERQDGTLVRILMTPISRRAIILGKTIYQVILQLIRAAIIIFLAFAILGIKMNGSWFLVALLLIIFTLCGVGVGMLLSTKANDMDSFFQLILLISMPSLFVTGVFFPLDSLPNWMKYIAYLMPLTYANNAMRNIMVKGQGLNFIFTDLVVLLIFSIIAFILGVYFFRSDS